MSYTNRICQTLHNEHAATVVLMERLGQLLARARHAGPPDKSDSGAARLLSDLAGALQGEVERHFAFEEDHIFTYLEANGDAGIGEHLTGEHATIRPIGSRVAMLARAAGTDGFAPAEWEEFARLAQQLADRLLSHVQKEEMALLPLIEENMDSETEARLYQQYFENA